MISHSHPDHFKSLEVIRDRSPQARVVSTANVIADIKADGPWMFSMPQNRLGPQGQRKLVIPEVLAEPLLSVDDIQFEVAELGEGEAKQIAAPHIPEIKAGLAADLVYSDKSRRYLRVCSTSSQPAAVPWPG